MSNESYTPPRAIIRMGKVGTQSAAVGKTIHNFRLENTPNADPARTGTMNQELVNIDQLDYWTLANKRIEEGIGKTARGKPRTVRPDQVRAVEFILTASPEWFKRDENGQAEDMRGSKWVADNLAFLKNTYGEKNVISFTLHQDEKTPHIHAVIVPLTDKNRLSADALFNPETLPLLQTNYAKAMAPHGLVRGVEGSRREHQDMKQVYGRQDKTATELGAQLGPASSYQDAVVKRPGVLDLRNLSEWEAKTSAQVNEKARTQVEEANKRAQEAVLYAVANAGSQERAEVLSRQLGVSEGLKQGHYKDLVEARKEKIELAVGLAKGGAIPDELVKLGAKLREEDRLDTIKTFEQHLLKGAYSTPNGYFKGLETKGLTFRTDIYDNPTVITHPRHGFVFTLVEIRPNGREIGEQVVELVEARRAAREKTEQDRERAALRKEIIAQGDRERAQKNEALRVQKHELSLMDQAFTIYRWKIRPDELTACLLVPKEKAEQVAEALRIEGSSYAASLGVQGEPMRKDGLEAVYVKYQTSFAHQIGSYMDRIRQIGGQVYEHTGSQTKREQLEAKPQQKAQEREQEIGKNRDQGQSM